MDLVECVLGDLEHLHVGPELLDEGLDDGLGCGRRGDSDALGGHFLPSFIFILRLKEGFEFQASSISTF